MLPVKDKNFGASGLLNPGMIRAIINKTTANIVREELAIEKSLLTKILLNIKRTKKLSREKTNLIIKKE